MEFWVSIAISLGGSLLVVGVAWGSEVSKRAQLETKLKTSEAELSAARTKLTSVEERHNALAAESRRELSDLRTQVTGYLSTVQHADREIASLKAHSELQRNEIVELKQTKASVDAVDGLREAIGRIDGKLDALLANRHQGP